MFVLLYTFFIRLFVSYMSENNVNTYEDTIFYKLISVYSEGCFSIPHTIILFILKGGIFIRCNTKDRKRYVPFYVVQISQNFKSLILPIWKYPYILSPSKLNFFKINM